MMHYGFHASSALNFSQNNHKNGIIEQVKLFV